MTTGRINQVSVTTRLKCRSIRTTLKNSLQIFLCAIGAGHLSAAWLHEFYFHTSDSLLSADWASPFTESDQSNQKHWCWNPEGLHCADADNRFRLAFECKFYELLSRSRIWFIAGCATSSICLLQKRSWKHLLKVEHFFNFVKSY